MGDASSAERTAARLPRWKLLLFSVGVTAALLALVEIGLAAAGVAPAYVLHDPLAGFASRIPHFVEEPGDDGRRLVRVVGSKRDEMNPQSFPAAKTAGTFRIFCLGGSTTYGHPFFDATSFCGWLRAFLPEVDPTRGFEVINAGAISYASYRITGLMKELLAYEPDLFLVYTGQNEFLERRTYEAILGAPTAITEGIALLNRTRTVAVLRSAVEALRGAGAEPDSQGLTAEVAVASFDAVGPEAFTRENTPREPVVRYFARALEGMVDLARGAGADVLLVSPASNLSHFFPFKSAPGPGLAATDRPRFEALLAEGGKRAAEGETRAALAALDAAASLDDRHAALHFERGRALLALGRAPEARAAFERAIEEDLVPFRAPAAIHAALRGVAASRDVPHVDFEALIAERSPDGIAGESLFFDHVHPTVEAHRLLALAVVDRLVEIGAASRADSWNAAAEAAATARVLDAVDPSAHAPRLQKLALVLERVGQPAQARKQALAALALQQGDPQSAYFAGALFQRTGRSEDAVLYLRRAADGMPNDPAPRTELGVALAAAGRADEARAAWEAALALDPDFARAHAHLGILLTRRERYGEAAAHLAEVARLEPGADANLNLGVVYVRLRRDSEAVPLLRSALQKRPDSVQARFLYGLALERTQRRAEAAAQYRQVLSRQPDHAPSRRRLRNLEGAGL